MIYKVGIISYRLFCFLACLQYHAFSQDVYRAELKRTDGLPIVFNVEYTLVRDKPTWYIRNAEERIRVDSIRQSADSVWVDMPFFESGFRLRADGGGGYQGNWIKKTTRTDQVMPVSITPTEVRFPITRGPNRYSASGRWRVTFTRSDGSKRPAIAILRQEGQRLTGTFLTPSGDYRYLEGVVSGDSLQLSCFDGSHAYYFGARLLGPRSISRGVYASGATQRESWVAEKDPLVTLDDSTAMMYLREGEGGELSFRFPDIDSQMVSILDQRFINKVVIVQIMGSWCPNCMDETAFLSRYYDSNMHRGVEVVAMAYEYSTDFQRVRKSLSKFRDRFQVRYPMLITGVTTNDSLRTQKTLPQLSPIKVFPTTIFVGKDGKVKKIHAGFYGPGTGQYHEEFKREFHETIERLLRE